MNLLNLSEFIRDKKIVLDSSPLPGVTDRLSSSLHSKYKTIEYLSFRM